MRDITHSYDFISVTPVIHTVQVSHRSMKVYRFSDLLLTFAECITGAGQGMKWAKLLISDCFNAEPCSPAFP